MTKERYEFLKTSEGEKELCDLIAYALEQESQTQKRIHNDGSVPHTTQMEAYWTALALDHAIQYVEDWKESIT